MNSKNFKRYVFGTLAFNPKSNYNANAVFIPIWYVTRINNFIEVFLKKFIFDSHPIELNE